MSSVHGRTDQEPAQADHPVEVGAALPVIPGNPAIPRRHPSGLPPRSPYRPASQTTSQLQIPELAPGKGGHAVGVFMRDQRVPHLNGLSRSQPERSRCPRSAIQGRGNRLRADRNRILHQAQRVVRTRARIRQDDLRIADRERRIRRHAARDLKTSEPRSTNENRLAHPSAMRLDGWRTAPATGSRRFSSVPLLAAKGAVDLTSVTSCSRWTLPYLRCPAAAFRYMVVLCRRYAGGSCRPLITRSLRKSRLSVTCGRDSLVSSYRKCGKPGYHCADQGKSRSRPILGRDPRCRRKDPDDDRFAHPNWKRFAASLPRGNRFSALSQELLDVSSPILRNGGGPSARRRRKKGRHRGSGRNRTRRRDRADLIGRGVVETVDFEALERAVRESGAEGCGPGDGLSAQCPTMAMHGPAGPAPAALMPAMSGDGTLSFSTAHGPMTRWSASRTNATSARRASARVSVR